MAMSPWLNSIQFHWIIHRNDGVRIPQDWNVSMIPVVCITRICRGLYPTRSIVGLILAKHCRSVYSLFFFFFFFNTTGNFILIIDDKSSRSSFSFRVFFAIASYTSIAIYFRDPFPWVQPRFNYSKYVMTKYYVYNTICFTFDLGITSNIESSKFQGRVSCHLLMMIYKTTKWSKFVEMVLSIN